MEINNVHVPWWALVVGAFLFLFLIGSVFSIISNISDSI